MLLVAHCDIVRTVSCLAAGPGARRWHHALSSLCCAAPRWPLSIVGCRCCPDVKRDAKACLPLALLVPSSETSRQPKDAARTKPRQRLMPVALDQSFLAPRTLRISSGLKGASTDPDKGNHWPTDTGSSVCQSPESRECSCGAPGAWRALDSAQRRTLRCSLCVAPPATTAARCAATRRAVRRAPCLAAAHWGTADGANRWRSWRLPPAWWLVRLHPAGLHPAVETNVSLRITRLIAHS